LQRNSRTYRKDANAKAKSKVEKKNQRSSLHLELTGLKVGKLTVINKTDKRCGNAVLWNCRCDCGNYREVRASHLKAGNVNSCGCLQREKVRGHKAANRKKFGVADQNRVIRNYKRHAKRRNLDFKLSKSECLDIFKNPCYYCNSSSKNLSNSSDSFGSFTYSGIDRRNNAEGYLLENVVSCCKKCNETKQNLEYLTFLNQVKSIYQNISAAYFPLLDVSSEKIAKSCLFEKAEFEKTGPNQKAPGVSARNILISRYKNDARARDLSFNLSKEQCTYLFSLNCFYCDKTPHRVQKSKGGGDFIYNGIDRINNNLGYEPDNVVSSCKTCNNWKKAMILEDFYKWVTSIAKNRLGLK